jgi:hypothetical protein
MIVLIPWKTVVVIWLLLSAMLWCGYVGSSLLEGKNPFAPYTLQVPHAGDDPTQRIRASVLQNAIRRVF